MSASSKTIHGILCDLSGVLHCGETPIEIAKIGFERLRELCRTHEVQIRFVTNTDYLSCASYLKDLNQWGFDIKENEIFTTCLAAKKIIDEKKLTPYYILNKEVYDDFKQGLAPCSQEFFGTEKAPESAEEIALFDSVVIADIGEKLNYAKLNGAFRILMQQDKETVLVGMGRARYYKREQGLMLDVGTFINALEFATSKQAIISGKPSKTFFLNALADMKVDPQNALMIGDDVVSDVGGAQAIGLDGILVRTGKYTPADEKRSDVQPNAVVDDFSKAITYIEKFYQFKKK